MVLSTFTSVYLYHLPPQGGAVHNFLGAIAGNRTLIKSSTSSDVDLYTTIAML